MARTFAELLGIFPDLGLTGAREEARWARKQLDPHILERVRHASRNRSEDVEKLLQKWVANSDYITQFFETARAENCQTAWSQAFEEVKSRRAMIAEPELSESAKHEADQRQKVWQLLQDRSAADDLGGISLGRGTAYPSSQFETQFKLGSVVHWDSPRACSIELDVVPLHFAWKAWSKLDAEPAQRTAVILNIEACDDRPVLGHWTGDIQGPYLANSYEWQAEVIAAPGFQYKIVSHEELNVAPGRVVRVRAVTAT